VFGGFAAFRPIARGGEIPILAFDRAGCRKPPSLGPRRSDISIAPIRPQLFATIERGDQAGQIVGLYRLVVIGVELEAVIIGV
jgi:hypothetical protein